MTQDKAVFRWELMKLLIQIVWADDEVAPEERRVLLGLAERLALSAEQIELVSACLDGGTPLPAPNMSILRERRDEVIQAAEQLVLADTEIAEDENRVLAELSALLGKAE
jgi:uncharacterized tellurite resistance protein B-like protein